MTPPKNMPRVPDAPTAKRRANRATATTALRREVAIERSRVEVFEILPARDLVRISIETVTHPREPERVIMF
jgi:hypothetical protein